MAKYTSDGNLVWRQEIPPLYKEEESFESLSVDANGDVYVVGRVNVYVDENLLVSIPDAFIAKHNGVNGQRLWSKCFKSQEQGEIAEEFIDVTVDRQGNVYVVGIAEGSLFGNLLGVRDVVIAKFDANGNMIWSKQWGGEKGESGVAIAMDRVGGIYVAGGTDSNLFSTNAGEADVFIVKFRQ